MSTTRLKISTPQGIFFEDDVKMVTLKTPEGYIGLQHNRLPFISSIEISPMYITSKNSEKKVIAISGGIVFVEKTYIDIFTDDIAWKEELNKTEIQRIIDEATKKLNEAKEDKVEKQKLEIKIKRALNKLVVIGTK